MLVLLESPAGYSLFKVSDASKFEKTDTEDIGETFFSSLKAAKKSLDLVSFQPFSDTADAVAAATSCCLEGKVPKGLQKFLQSQLKKDSSSASKLVVADPKLGTSLKEAFGSKKLTIMSDTKTNELFRGIRCYMEELLDESLGTGSQQSTMKALQLGLSHSLSRYKLKFSADKVDTMVIQAVGLLDELDKEINTYAMRTKEWYGWHFPELQALIADNPTYAKLVLKCGMRTNFSLTDLSEILPEETLEQRVKDTAEVSMGTEVADLDILNIQSLAEQVLSMSEYRAQLYEYLKNRMNAIAPNLTILVGELVGARLLSHAGSLMNLAKQPASTIQILGAEKALFRALKTKHATPKYGLIYHASLIGQAAPKNKGKISRVLAAKAALAVRVDALSDDIAADGNEIMADTTIGYEGRAKVEARLRQLEGGSYRAVAAGTGTEGKLTAAKTAKYDPVAAKSSATGQAYNTASDMVLEAEGEDDDDEEDESPKKKKKKSKKDNGAGDDEDAEKSAKKKKKKDKKRKAEEGEDDEDDAKKASKPVNHNEDEDDEKPKKKKSKKENGDKEDSGKHDPDSKEAKKAAKKAKKEKSKSKD